MIIHMFILIPIDIKIGLVVVVVNIGVVVCPHVTDTFADVFIKTLYIICVTSCN